MGFDWEEILGSGNLEEAWNDAVFDAARMIGGWRSPFSTTFTIGETIDEDFLLDSMDPRIAKNGNPYFVLTLRRSVPDDTIKACLFSPEGVLTTEDVGKTAHVRGMVAESQGYPYLKLRSIAVLGDENRPAVVATLNQGCKVDGKFILQKAAVKTASNGKPYFSGMLVDNSGWIPVRVWNYTGALSERDNGKIVAVKGMVTSFRDRLQVEATEIGVAE